MTFGLTSESQSKSFFDTTTIVSFFKSAIHEINLSKMLAGYYVIAGVASQRTYTLPGNFIQENHVRWRGIPLQRRAPSEFPVTTSSTSDPNIYTILPYSQVVDANDPMAQGVQVLVVDPVPANAGTGTPPLYPKTSDYFFSLWYYTRIPTDFNATSTDPKYINNYTFYIPDEFMSIIAFKAISLASYADGAEGVADRYDKMMLRMLEKYKENSNWDSLRRPQQVQVANGVSGYFPFNRGY